MTGNSSPTTNRPDSIVLIAGTATEIGKTWVATRLITELRTRQIHVQARKPAQSFHPQDPTTDADLLAQASGEDPRSVCPEHRCYAVEMAPPMAADSLGRSAITLAELADELSTSWTPTPLSALPAESGCPLGCIELAGGLWSPIAHDGDCLDLAKLLSPELVILVADAGLGTINAIRPAVAALAEVAPVSVFLNRFDSTAELHNRNRMWLEQKCQIDATTSISQLADELLRVVGTPSPAT